MGLAFKVSKNYLPELLESQNETLDWALIVLKGRKLNRLISCN